jgi:hypothetical protein
VWKICYPQIRVRVRVIPVLPEVVNKDEKCQHNLSFALKVLQQQLKFVTIHKYSRLKLQQQHHKCHCHRLTLHTSVHHTITARTSHCHRSTHLSLCGVFARLTSYFGLFGYCGLLPELSEIISGFQICYPLWCSGYSGSGFSGSGSGFSGSGFGYRVLCPA